MRKVDLLILVACGVAMYLSFQSHGDLDLRPAFFEAIDPSLYKNGHSPTLYDRIPDPLVTDLDGDGRNEIVVVTREPKVKILDPDNAVIRDNQDTNWATLPVKYSTSLFSLVRVAYGRQPVALASGYLDPYDPNGTPRKQYVCVVTQEWTVLLFDHTLKLLWETNLQENFQHHYVPTEVTVLIAHTPLLQGDKGMIVVGGRTQELRKADERGRMAMYGGQYSADESDLEEEGEDSVSSDGSSLSDEDKRAEKENAEEEKAKIEARSGHFSYYALDGSRGTLRWHHEVSDFEPALHPEEVLYPQRNYKLELRDTVRHAGEADWRLYKDSLIETLPHSWQGPEDTILELAHFSKHRQRGRASNPTHKRQTVATRGHQRGHGGHRKNARNAAAANEHSDSWVRTALRPDHIPGLSFGGYLPHDASDHVENPNVIVAHISEGVEVLHLYTGRPICKLSLQDGTYADVNGDHVIDHVVGVLSERAAIRARQGKYDVPKCQGLLATGIPTQEAIGNVSICSKEEASVFNLEDATPDYDEHDLSTINPIVLHRVERGANAHIRQYDVVYMVNTGRITSISSDATINWQTHIGSTWDSEQTRKVDEEDTHFYFSVVPSLSVLRPLVHGSEEQILVAGSEYCTILDAHGAVLVSTHLPEPPVAPAIKGDFSNDGWTDVIIVSRQGIYGYSLEPSAGVTIFKVLVAFLTLVLVSAFLFKQATDLTSNAKTAPGRKAYD